MADKAEDPEHAEQGREQTVHEEEEGLQRLDPRKKKTMSVLEPSWRQKYISRCAKFLGLISIILMNLNGGRLKMESGNSGG